jgi:nicotinamide-nucleotide amidase
VTLFATALLEKARDLLGQCEARGLTIVTAESCTGGLVAAVLTEIPGSSSVVERGYVTYSNGAKHALLGVPDDLIDDCGAVSAPVAQAMVEGALAVSGADLAVAITGVAGPGGGSADKPVGLVHFAAKRAGREVIELEKRFGDIGRTEVRLASVEVALTMLEQLLTQRPPPL